jgi:4,5-dihydroxyphthalate decarboxylase
MLLDGEVDAAILGMNMPKDPRVRTLIPDPGAAALAWHARERLVPPNHYVIVPEALCDQRPDVVRELWRMLVESRRQAASESEIDAWPVGIEANRRALACAIKYATQQHMLTKPVAVEDLFHPLVREIAP